MTLYKDEQTQKLIRSRRYKNKYLNIFMFLLFKLSNKIPK